MLVFFLHLQYKIIQRISLLIHCYSLFLHVYVNIAYYVWHFGFNFRIVRIQCLAYIKTLRTTFDIYIKAFQEYFLCGFEL
jgi:hypothetical protein